MSHSLKSRPAFTIVETTIAMAFISILLISISSVTLQIVNFYRKGLVLKSVNQVGRLIGDDFSRSIASGTGIDVAKDFRTDDVNFGVLCTGDYTYVWNYGKSLTSASLPASGFDPIKFKNGGADDVLRLIKLKDRERIYCSAESDPGLARNAVNDQIDKSASEVIELIRPGDGNLALQNFQITKGLSDDNTDQALFTVEFVLGTYSSQNIIKDASCVLPSDAADGDLSSYCAINKFEISSRGVIR